MPSENAHFSIIYDGEGLAEGSIDVKDLAPALLALAEVVDEAQPLVPELDARLSLRVRSNFEHGSFEVHLELAKLYQQIVGLFSGQDATAFANLFQILCWRRPNFDHLCRLNHDQGSEAFRGAVSCG